MDQPRRKFHYTFPSDFEEFPCFSSLISLTFRLHNTLGTYAAKICYFCNFVSTSLPFYNFSQPPILCHPPDQIHVPNVQISPYLLMNGLTRKEKCKRATQIFLIIKYLFLYKAFHQRLFENSTI